MSFKAGKTAEEIGYEIQEAFARSTSQGWNTVGEHLSASGVEGYHIPEIEVDGLMIIDREALAREGKAFEKVDISVTVDRVRPIADDTVILETRWTGTVESGDFDLPMAFIFTVMAGKIVRAIETYSHFATPVGQEVWEKIATAGYHGGSAVNVDTGALSAGA